MSNKFDCYAMINRDGIIQIGSLKFTKRDCIKKFLCGTALTWKELRKIGWRCIKVNIVEA